MFVEIVLCSNVVKHPLIPLERAKEAMRCKRTLETTDKTMQRREQNPLNTAKNKEKLESPIA